MPSDPLGESKKAVENLQNRTDALADQVREHGNKADHRLLLTLAVPVSVVAALVSIVSTIFTLSRESRYEEHALRNELTQMIQRLTAMQDAQKDGSDEYGILGRLAYDTATKIDDQVSAPELSIIAGSLLASGEAEKALMLANRALGRAERSFNDTTWALRQKGWIEFQIEGKVPEPTAYATALVTYKGFNLDENAIGVRADRALTLVEFGEALAITGDCSGAQEKKDSYLQLLPSIVFRNDQEKLEGEARDLDRYLEKCKPGIAGAATRGESPSKR